MEIAKGIGRLFYVINPNDTYVKTLQDLPNPDYVTQATPYFISFIILEYLIQWYRGKPVARFNDGIVSLSHGMFIVCGVTLTRGLESYAYIKIYDNYRLFTLPWDSPWTWYLAALGVDFGYYWIHRAGHELNLFWSQHQVHHSSEDYNLTTALRQSGLQALVVWVFYLPLAFFVPPPIFLIHAQFNLIYQFWIHTEVVGDLGPLEYIFNTPKHHRLHHGSNRYCLDKNYAGFLIIWDRMFGTFEKERPGEEIVYGLVEDVTSMNPFWLQVFYFPKTWARMHEYSSWKDKAGVWINGPGWAPGKPRLGDPMDCPEVPIRSKYDPQIPTWQTVYALVHFLVVLALFDYMGNNILMFSQLAVFAIISYIIAALTSIGLVLEGRNVAARTEISRCLFTVCVLSLLGASSQVKQVLLGFFLGSSVLWVLSIVKKGLKDDCSKKVD